MGEVGDKLKDYTIIQEGEAQILMHTKNTVFYNKAQVNNRDMSIAILRTFIEKRKEEHAAMLAKKGKSEIKVHETSEEATAAQVEATNGDCSLNAKEPMSEQVSGPKEPISSASWKDKREMKAPKVLEALAASGLRAIRYALEVEGVGQVVAVDNDKDSVEACKKNIKFNGSVACAKVEAHHADARIYMLTHEKEFDVVDLDPYGTPSVFLDSAVQSVAEGGLLMCTATDMAVLCGNTGEVCYTKYGSYPVKGKYCHEMALRILLACIESHANRYKRYIVPVLSVHMDFYVRVFVRIYTSASEIKNTPLKLSYVYQCVGCDSFHLQSVGRTVIKDKSVKHMPGTGPVVSQVCSDCGKKYNMGGPIWSAPMHDQDWVLSALANIRAMEKKYPAYEKICAVLTTVSEELHDVPLFVCLHSVCATLKCTSPTAVMFRSAVINAGYRISGSHVSPLALKTDAPMNVIWDIMRCWVKNHPVKGQQQGQPESSGTAILSEEPTLQANFSRAGASFSKAQAKKAARFLPNPERHWGPKVRAGRQITSKHVSLLGPEALNAVQSSNKGKEKDVPDLSSGKVNENSESVSPITKRQKCDDSATES